MDWHPDKLLTPKEIHEAGGPAPRSLERLRAVGGGPRFTRIGPKVIRYRAGDYTAWLAANTFASTAQEYASRHMKDAGHQAATAIPQTQHRA